MYGKYIDGYKELSRNLCPNGYYRTRLYLTDGSHCDIKLHRLILESYTRYILGPHINSLSDMTNLAVDHIDRNRTNNDISNLRWMLQGDHLTMHRLGDAWVERRKELNKKGEKNKKNSSVQSS